jgi:hypothetical protein
MLTLDKTRPRESGMGIIRNGDCRECRAALMARQHS